MNKVVSYGLNEASVSIPGNSGIQRIKTSDSRISSTTRASGVCERSWVRGFVSVEHRWFTVYI